MKKIFLLFLLFSDMPMSASGDHGDCVLKVVFAVMTIGGGAYFFGYYRGQINERRKQKSEIMEKIKTIAPELKLQKDEVREKCIERAYKECERGSAIFTKDECLAIEFQNYNYKLRKGVRLARLNN